MTLCNLPGLVAACLPWRSAAWSESREFWVSDENCFECYDCGSTFTFYNRRHHCRECGRIFCWRCASNWIPSPSTWSKDLEDRDTIRVCNQCFKHSQPRSVRRDSIDGNDRTAAVEVGEQSGSILESILNCFLPDRVKFVATSSLYAAGLDSEVSFKKKSKNDDDRDKKFEMWEWQLSFAKFLGLNFSNRTADTRCGFLRFYRSREMVACFHYASMDIHSVYLPPRKLDFSYENHEFMEKECNEVAGRAAFMFSEVLNALRLLVERKTGSAMFNSGMKVPDSGHRLADLEKMLQKEKSEFEESLQKISKQGHPSVDILELNRLRRQLVFQSYIWDHRLIYAINSLDDKIQTDDAKVTCTESIQEAVATIEKLRDINVPVKTGDRLDCSDSVSRDAMPDRSPEHGASTAHHEALHQRTDADLNFDPQNQNLATDESDTLQCEGTISRVPSDDEARVFISGNLDAAWTDKNHPGVAISKNNLNLSKSVEGDKLSNFIRVSEKSHVENHMEAPKVMSRSTSLISPKSSDNTEDTGWLGMSFLRSLSKNFLGSAQKLENLAEYDPVYISLFRDSELLDGARFLLPEGVKDIVIPVYDDEPTSAVAYALVSPDYLNQMSDEPKGCKETKIYPSSVEMTLASRKSLESGDDTARVCFYNVGPPGKRYTVTCYYAKSFEALRKLCCPSEIDFVRSLSRCKRWGAQGGNSNPFFSKTYDERFIIKQVTKTELESFLKFAPQYFKYLSELIDGKGSTCLAKILGIYQVRSKPVKGGKESKMAIMVMENLLYGRTITRLHEIKGSTRSRYDPDSPGSNKVLFDQNLIEAKPTPPIFVGSQGKKMLERAVWNDTSFLCSVDVMDYSLLVGVDEQKHELVVGIIDFMRQYTRHKHLDTWVKAQRILGRPKISPGQYKKRFRKATRSHILLVPDQQTPPSTPPWSDRDGESIRPIPTCAE